MANSPLVAIGDRVVHPGSRLYQTFTSAINSRRIYFHCYSQTPRMEKDKHLTLTCDYGLENINVFCDFILLILCSNTTLVVNAFVWINCVLC
jgi:hypothetical protein